jgi:hypothetical protein
MIKARGLALMRVIGVNLRAKGQAPPDLPPKVDIRGSENEQNKQNPVTDLRTAFFFLRHAEKYTTAGKRLISDWCVS